VLDERLQRTAIAPDDWTLGLRDAPLAIVEYGDFECPYCAAARPTLESLIHENRELVRLVFRHFPVTSAHPHAFGAAEAAEAAGAQGAFWEMHDLLFSNRAALEHDDLLSYAGELGLDLPRFDRELGAHFYAEEIRQDFHRGIRDGVNGTPTLFVDGLRYDGPREKGALLEAVTLRLNSWSERHGPSPG
jgi:protein-disulfide isomerase